MKGEVWITLINSLFETSNEAVSVLPGQDINEWLELSNFDYDEVDRDLIDVETEGGG